MDQIINELNSPNFWNRAWEMTGKNSASEQLRIRSASEEMEYWNKYALNNEKRNSLGKSKERLQQVLKILKKEHFITKESNVLDIGCGSGLYAIAFSLMCRSVTALDGASEMCRLLEQKITDKNIKNINVLYRMWEEIDIEKEGFRNQFDLVFASMTPAIYDYKTLMKMNYASKKNCCLIFWAENGHNQTRDDLWKIIIKKGYPDFARASIIYPFNLLFSMGYFPTIQYINAEWENNTSIDNAVDCLCNYFWRYIEITPQIKDKITEYIISKAKNNIFYNKTEARLGVVTWKNS
jgi:SAM-dependent methyltransferase